MPTLVQLAMVLVSMICEIATAQIEPLECGSTRFSGPSGVVKYSPHLYHQDPRNSSCTFFIDVGRSNSVTLKFATFDFQLFTYPDDCHHEWVTIACSEMDAGEKQNFNRKYCSTLYETTSLRLSDCPVVTLEFFLDINIFSWATFEIEYTVVEKSSSVDIPALDCGDTLFTNSSGVISLPTNPLDFHARVNCTYIISTNQTNKILLRMSFEKMQLMESFQDCDTDSFTVGCVSSYKETELNPSTVKTYCSDRLTVFPIQPSHIAFSNCRMAKISIRSSYYNLREATRVDFTVGANDEDCGNTLFTGPNGEIASPHFPLSYSRSLDCVYFIEVDHAKTLSLHFKSLYMGGTWLDGCEYGSLMISCLLNDSLSEIPSQSRKYCGDRTRPPPDLIYSNCDTVKLHFNSDSDVPVSGTGFQLTYTTKSPGEDCGKGYFVGPAGVITTPSSSISKSLLNNLNCVYSIDVDRTKTVLLYFFSFNFRGSNSYGDSEDCFSEWLMISCLSNGSASLNPPQNIRYCVERRPPMVLRYSNCDSLTLNFVTAPYYTYAMFELWYTIMLAGDSGCGNNLFSGPKGVINSPNFPLPYPPNVSCTYFIDVGRNNSVILKFIRFDLEKPNAAGYCVDDWLMITCNETTEANPNTGQKYCGNIEWRSSMRFLNCPSLVLEFSGSSSITNGTGFIIEYTVAENSGSVVANSELDCGNTVVKESYGDIHLPGNPTEYLAKVNCTYTLSVDQTSTIFISLVFGHSKLFQSFQDCNRENIEIGCVAEGETELNPNTTRVFCSRDRATTPHLLSSQYVFSDCRTLKLSIRSVNYDFEGSRFEGILHVPFLVVAQKKECGNTSFSAPSGIISSPQLPWPYLKDFKCLYTIAGGQAKSVVLSFGRLHLGTNNMMDSGSCQSNWLAITCLVNGTSMAHPFANRKLCGTLLQLVVRFPDCHFVLLNYSSDKTTYDIGFTVRYRLGDFDEECGNTSFNGSTGVITSPRFPLSYPHNLDCMYSIVGGPRYVIHLSFLVFQLDGTSNTLSTDSCSNDWLIITCLSDEPDSANVSPSRKYCGIKTKPLAFAFSNCPVVVINFVTDSSVSHGGFRLQYKVRDTDVLCGVRFHDRPSGAISFPWNYTNFGDNFDCNYVINSTENSSISLTIWSISLESLVGENCTRDWLQITCVNGQPALKHNVSHITCNCLNSSSQITFSSCSEVAVIFHKDATATGKAFYIEYTITGYGDFVVNTQMNLSGKTGHSVAISVVIIVVVVAAVGLAALFLYRRHRSKHRSEALLHANEEETAQMESEKDTAEAGTSFAASCSQDGDTSKYVPLRSLSHHEDSASSKNSAQFNEEMQPCLSD